MIICVKKTKKYIVIVKKCDKKEIPKLPVAPRLRTNQKPSRLGSPQYVDQ